MIERKTFTGEVKSDGVGSLVATFSTFGVVDYDGDVVLASAIPDGLETVLGAYNHASHIGTALPVGKGVMRNDGSKAQIVATFFDTPDAQAHRETIKGLGRLAEFSYAFKVLEQSTDFNDLKQYGPNARRIISAVDVVEVCAVIRGASIGTGTDSAKGTLVHIDGLPELREQLAAVRARALMAIDGDFIEALERQSQSRFVKI